MLKEHIEAQKHKRTADKLTPARTPRLHPNDATRFIGTKRPLHTSIQPQEIPDKSSDDGTQLPMWLPTAVIWKTVTYAIPSLYGMHLSMCNCIYKPGGPQSVHSEPAWPNGKQKDLGSHPLRLSFLLKQCGLWTLSCGFVPHN